MSDPTAPPVLVSCNGAGTAGTATAGGFKMCSGTSGGSQGPTGPIPNAELYMTRVYQTAFNSTSEGGPTNPCISQGVPQEKDLKPGSPNPVWNTVPFSNGLGCCSPPSAWPTGSKTNVSRITRLTPFSTASSPGAKNDANMSKGIPVDILGFTKVWGTSPSNWMHGGTHAANVGQWVGNLSGKPFTVKTPHQGSWTQRTMLWCRMTGDKYDPTKDPYGTKNPAPNGSYLGTKAKLAQFGIGDDPTYEQEFKACESCTTTVVAPPTADAPCHMPFYQTCAQLPNLDIDTMSSPDGIVQGFSSSATTNYTNTTSPYDASISTGYSDPKGRVGGCFCTQQLYGPGKFSVLLNLPPTAPAKDTDGIVVKDFPMIDPFTGKYPSTVPGAVQGGRGYVFSMWTFGYSEAYPGAPAKDAPPSPYNMPNVLISNSAISPVADVVQEGVFSNGNIDRPYVGNIVSGSSSNGFWATHNHEIDIEIPSNTGQTVTALGKSAGDVLGLNTANFNTWVTDCDSYTPGTKVLYQQAQATAPQGQFFASVGPGEDESTFHELSFVWYVDPADEVMSVSGLPPPVTTSSNGDPALTPAEQTFDANPPPTQSYVAFYRDGVEIFKCFRFVPRRSGRVVFGLWPAWWGSNYQPLTYNHVYARIARVDFVPQCDIDNKPFSGGALVTNAAQMYDQELPVPSGIPTAALATIPGMGSQEIACGFDLATLNRVPPPPSKKFPIWVIILIAILVVIVIVVAITTPVVLEKQKRKKSS